MYFFDSYAIIEYLRGNERFRPYFAAGGKVTVLTLMEVYFHILSGVGSQKAEEVYNTFLPSVVELTDETIKDALQERLKLKRNGLNISYADAVGYMTAVSLNIKFLTGDKEFEGLDSVEFVR